MSKKLICLIIFSIAFGYVEAAVVFYLRLLLNYGTGYLQDGYTVLLNLGIIAFVNPNTPLLKTAQITLAEVTREVFTIIMIAAVSYLAAGNFKQRAGAFMISFATWDIFYYVFLYFLAGWPKSLFDTDVYFLIPVVWIGPVMTPVLISTILFITGSILYLNKTGPFRIRIQ